MPIRILHVVDNMGIGGLQNGLANLIARLDPARFEHVICAARPVKPADEQPITAGTARILCLGKREGSRGSQFTAFARVIRDVQPDIVHSRNWATIEAAFAARWTSRRLIHSEHGIDAAFAAREPRRRRWLRRLAFELADRVFSVSYQLRDFYAQRTGFPGRRVEVIHNGVDQARFFRSTDTRERTRATLGIAPCEFCIGCVGNLTPVKDHITLLQAMDKFSREYDDWRLLFVGDGPEYPRLLEFVNARPGWAERVLFLGRRTNVPELLNAMDVYVLPSLSEGICNSLLEAMAAGLPVIASETGGNPEVAVNQESGLLFPVGDTAALAGHLLSLRGQSDLRMRLGLGALSRVQREFSIDAMVESYARLYESVATQRK